MVPAMANRESAAKSSKGEVHKTSGTSRAAAFAPEPASRKVPEMKIMRNIPSPAWSTPSTPAVASKYLGGFSY